MVDQQRDVLRMFAQRRDAHDDHSDAVVKVFAEIALPDLLAQVLVRGGDDAYVDLDVLVAAYAADPVPDFITFLRHHIAHNDNQRVT